MQYLPPPLHAACWYKASYDVIKILLDAYPSEAAQVQNCNFNLPLHQAAVYSDAEAEPNVIKILLEAFLKGTKAQNKAGSLPLHFVCEPCASKTAIVYPEGAEIKRNVNNEPLVLLHISWKCAWMVPKFNIRMEGCCHSIVHAKI